MSDSRFSNEKACLSIDPDVTCGPRRLDTRTIFRQMIAGELRAGRLDRARRARIVRYAAQLGLSAVEAGRLIEECRQEALGCEDLKVRQFALRIAEPSQPFIPTPLKIAGVILIALIVDVLLFRWLFG